MKFKISKKQLDYKNNNQYYNLGIECVLDKLTDPISHDLNLDKYIHEIFKRFFIC